MGCLQEGGGKRVQYFEPRKEKRLGKEMLVGEKTEHRLSHKLCQCASASPQLSRSSENRENIGHPAHQNRYLVFSHWRQLMGGSRKVCFNFSSHAVFFEW